MEDFLNSIRRVPQVVRVVVNSGRKVTGSFIDPEWVLHYISKGEWLFELESKSYHISQGDMVLVPPHLLHVVRPKKGGELVQYVIHFNLFDRPFHPGDLPYAVETGKGSRRRIMDQFHELKEVWLRQRGKRGLASAGGLMILLGFYAESIRTPRPARPREGVHWGNIERAIRYIQDAHSRIDLDLGAISREARLSPNYLCRVFKNCLGVPVMKYVTKYRIQKAEEMLLNSSLNCSEIAGMVGFEGIHIFSRLFRKYKGIPPTEYRALHLG